MNILKIATDNGNGYEKVIYDFEGKTSMLTYPSIASKLNEDNIIVDNFIKNEEIDKFIKNMVDMIDLSFESPLVKDKSRRLFGSGAINSGLPIEQFNVFSGVSKSEVDLSGVLSLTSVAISFLTSIYEKNGSFDEDYEIFSDISLALPIEDHKAYSASFREKFLNSGNPHKIIVHNFEKKIVINVTFQKVLVCSEGEVAYYSIKESSAKLEKAILDEFKSSYGDIYKDITLDDILGVDNIVGIDVGEGTTDIALFTSGRFNNVSSSTYNVGYGNVLETTLTKSQRLGYKYKTRKSLGEFLLKKREDISPFKKSEYDELKGIESIESANFSDVLIDELIKRLDQNFSSLDLIYVYGGGASPLKSNLYPKLREALTRFGNKDLPIIYLPSTYSRFLNVKGMFIKL